jgi:hypothetical protein
MRDSLSRFTANSHSRWDPVSRVALPIALAHGRSWIASIEPWERTSSPVGTFAGLFRSLAAPPSIPSFYHYTNQRVMSRRTVRLIAPRLVAVQGTLGPFDPRT